MVDGCYPIIKLLKDDYHSHGAVLMNSVIQNLYLKLPRSLQNVAITAYGIKEFNTRYGNPLSVPFDSIASHQSLSPDQLHALQNARLQRIVRYAAENVRYYQQLFQRKGIDPGEVSIDNFRTLIPVLEKAEVVANPASFVSTRLPPDILRLFTSGTSGSPMPIVCLREARAINYAFFRKMLLQHGCDVRDRSATFAGRVLFLPHETQVFWRKDYFANTLLMSSYHLTDSSIPLYIAALEAWQPKYIDSYPSAIGEVARYICERGLKPKLNLSFVLTSSETLSESHSDFIKRAFGCHVLDHYGCTEMAVSAHTRADDGRYSLESLYSLVEFEPEAMADTASLICTGLLNMAMPLLRYRIGDTVSDPQIGRVHPFIDQSFERVIGRQDDMIVTPDGRRIGRLDPVFKGLTGIKQAQIIQTDTATLEVLLVSMEAVDKDAVVSLLTENLLSRTNRDMKIAIKFVDSIALTKSGKFKSVISRLKRDI